MKYYKTGRGHVIGFEDFLFPLLGGNPGSSMKVSVKVDLQHTRKFTAHAMNRVEALELPAALLLDIGEQFPGVLANLLGIAEERLAKLIKRKNKALSEFKLRNGNQEAFESIENKKKDT